ncbi:hypothetical protein VCSRO140_3541 [Vibrio cholerae]|nr:hypothetical protein VCSRO140_3541 [Vibrio cholerae]
MRCQPLRWALYSLRLEVIEEQIKSLFKYRPVNEFTLDIIANNRIYYSKPETFNDPYDTEYFLRSSKRRHSNEHVENYDQIVNRYNERYRDIIRSTGILSLSQADDNLLLWAHYAEDHKGICIEFERNPDNILGNDSSTKPVRYTQSYPSFERHVFMSAESSSVVHRILWTKSKHWAYEQEWRVIVNEGDTVKPLPGKILSITFGMRCSERSRDIIKKLVSGTDIVLKQADKLANRYGIKIARI